MIFIGDIAAPRNLYPPPSTFGRAVANQIVVGNLEGAILRNASEAGGAVLYNDPAVIDYLKSINVKVVSLANNHVFDINQDIGFTIDRLSAEGISSCGAGPDVRSAAVPALVVEDGHERVFVAFGWQTIECQVARGSRPGVNALTTDNVLAQIRAARERYPFATLVALPHWNYELEAYPMPMHRELGFRAIDAGADAVIGCHPHCVQGIEVYQDKPIVYSLGNWFLAQGEYFGGKLTFPSFATLQLAFEWSPETQAMMCHWFEYGVSDHSLTHVGSEPLLESERVRALTPFAGMTASEYVRWFRVHRRKRKLLPVYANPDARLANAVRDSWVRGRHQLLETALRLGLKGGPR